MNNNHQDGYNRYPPPSRELVESKKRKNEFVSLPLLSRAVTQEAKFSKNFANAEWLFNEIMLDYQACEKNENGRHFTHADEKSFATSMTTMVRYASTPAKAMYYATMFFKVYNERIRTPSREVIILTNLIFAHTNHPTQENMEVALNVLKLALQIGVYTIDPCCYQDQRDDNHNFADPVEVFTSISKKVLNYFKMTLSFDKTELVPFVASARMNF
ncbi:hypothetical protein [Parasitella parasitica]|uniref:Uncharacterized protein n=1 Tax=Parasitella parasitica TaxID=35722 RepID=A0A0B7NEG2_9FUNG|nr:hypothetical protein [Parasitella parasitica]